MERSGDGIDRPHREATFRGRYAESGTGLMQYELRGRGAVGSAGSGGR